MNYSHENRWLRLEVTFTWLISIRPLTDAIADMWALLWSKRFPMKRGLISFSIPRNMTPFGWLFQKHVKETKASIAADFNRQLYADHQEHLDVHMRFLEDD